MTSTSKLIAKLLIEKSRDPALALNESDDYYPDSKLTWKDLHSALVIGEGSNREDGESEYKLVRIIHDKVANVKPTDEFNQKRFYALTDGKNYLHLDFNEAGKCTGASRYGPNDVQNMVDYFGFSLEDPNEDSDER